MDEGKNLSIATTDQVKQVLREVMKEFREQPTYLTAKRAAVDLDVSESFILKAKNDGLLECYQPTRGGIVRFTRQHLENFMKRTKNTK